MDKYVKDLKIGDKINMHERGWLKIIKIERGKPFSKITFENGETIPYKNDDILFAVS